ncbi:MAG: hypothetical protein VB101_09040 [Rhodospirillaceae bacterium]|nr:hypothetical protein [Rhodospirillaceae bacterium]
MSGGTSAVAIAGMAMAAVGTAVSAYSAHASGQQAKAQGNYQAQIAKNNAEIATQNAKDTEAAGRAEEQRQRIANAQKLGAIRAEAGATGVDVGYGTALDTVADQTMIGEYDALTTRNNSQRQANSYYQQASNFMNDSSSYQTAASNATLNGTLSAGGTLLSGAGKVAGSWYDYAKGLPSSDSKPATTFSAGYKTPDWYTGKGYPGGFGL